jgi:hypothetical protein
MSTAEVSKLSVVDDRILQRKPVYAVQKGAMSVTNAKFSAIANSSSAQTFNIQVPSENVFVDRAVDWQNTIQLVVTVTTTGTLATNAPILLPGRDFAPAAFPMNQLLSTLQATINDTTVTINTPDVLDKVLRLADLKDARRMRTCPTMLDKYVAYPDTTQVTNSPLNGYDHAQASDEAPNGAFQITYYTDGTFGTVLANQVGLTPSSGGVTSASYFGVGGLPYNTASASGQTFLLFVSITSTEKLVLSPFIFGDEYELSTGLFGVQNIQITANFQSPSRVLRAVVPTTYNGATRTISTALASTPFTSSFLNVQFLTPALDVPLPAKSIVPYLEFPRYISSTYVAPAGATSGLSSQTITLPAIPDYIIIYARPVTYASFTPTAAGSAAIPANCQGDWVLPITGISVNFDNFSGLLSSHTQQELYKMSLFNGVDMDWNTWSGIGNVYNTSAAATGGSAASVGGIVGTTAGLVGGPLVLRPGRDFALQAGQAPGLVGNFTFQFTASIYNQTGAPQTVAWYVVTANSGFFETIKGSSRVIKGVLTEQDILGAKMAPESAEDVRLGTERLTGEGKHRSHAHARAHKSHPRKHGMAHYM